MTTLKDRVRSTFDLLGLSPLYVRYFEWRKTLGQEQPPAASEDGVPLPPLYLISQVTGTADWRWFSESGAITLPVLDGFAKEAGPGFAGARRILDFGCGCGRLVRHLPKMTEAEVYGVDYNSSLINWCARNLKGVFRKGGRLPPVGFPDQHFDLIYLFSVFTHMRRDSQMKWLQELRRVTAPNGVVLITFHDEFHHSLATMPEGRAELSRSGFFVLHDHFEGSNRMATYQTCEVAAQMFSSAFEVVKVIPSPEANGAQAVAVLRRSA